MWLFTIVSYIALYLLLAFCALCLATGLYYLSELTEEFTRLTSRIIRYIIRAVCVLYALLWLLDDFPFIYVLFGLLAHGAYLSMLKNFPFFSVRRVEFVASVASFVINQYLWYRFFTSPYVDYYTVLQIFSFYFLMVWLVPFSLFISLSFSDSSLPLSGPAGLRDSQTETPSSSAATGSGPLYVPSKRIPFLKVLRAKCAGLALSLRSLLDSLNRA